jgi:hypothetical protein
MAFFLIFGGIRRSTLLAYFAEAAALAAKAGRSLSCGPSPEGFGAECPTVAFIHELTPIVFCEDG